MTLKALRRGWNQFFFTPQSPIAIALFRILYGIVLMANLILLWPEWLTWYGAHAWMSLSTMYKIEPGLRLNLFTVLPQSDLWAKSLFWVALLSALLLTLGFMTRLSSIAAFVCLTSIHQRNLLILHSGDTFLRVAGFFLIFAPAGAALSMDRILRVRSGKQSPEIAPRSPWAQRMIQLELSLLYFFSFWWKSMGVSWVNGTALYYIIHLDEIRRFPVPAWVQRPLVAQLGTWFTLVLEFALGVLIWIKELRYPLLLLGVLFHLCLEYSLNIPIFQWDVLTAYVLFVDGADLQRAWRWIRARVTVRRRTSEALP